ncbi:uncharacterized protein LOC121370742 [Gigantopelta aegis]|uniref:uncharacterized protein LOC121370742 n=1 Tax=Gigantopelta aegis TaxID=1735272 RepID=UPI001B88809B|nr:uncharacterized protein LOC121370742 [Gigantopelta aegis]XP_041352109.1 uncharacterized protein LOC121370742 [Gigantopelta aegis]
MKLFVLLLIFTCVAWQQSDAVLPKRRGRWWSKYRIIASMLRLPIVRLGRDIGKQVDTDDDGYLDETELEKYFGQRDVLDFVAALDEDGDDLLSIDEFNNKQ